MLADRFMVYCKLFCVLELRATREGCVQVSVRHSRIEREATVNGDQCLTHCCHGIQGIIRKSNLLQAMTVRSPHHPTPGPYSCGLTACGSPHCLYDDIEEWFHVVSRYKYHDSKVIAERWAFEPGGAEPSYIFTASWQAVSPY